VSRRLNPFIGIRYLRARSLHAATCKKHRTEGCDTYDSRDECDRIDCIRFRVARLTGTKPAVDDVERRPMRSTLHEAKHDAPRKLLSPTMRRTITGASARCLPFRTKRELSQASCFMDASRFRSRAATRLAPRGLSVGAFRKASCTLPRSRRSDVR
jgi:hypothetical protein